MKLENMTKKVLIAEIDKLQKALFISDQQLNAVKKEMNEKDKILAIIQGKGSPKVLVRKAVLYDMIQNKEDMDRKSMEQNKDIEFFKRVLTLNV